MIARRPSCAALVLVLALLGCSGDGGTGVRANTTHAEFTLDGISERTVPTALAGHTRSVFNGCMVLLENGTMRQVIQYSTRNTQTAQSTLSKETTDAPYELRGSEVFTPDPGDFGSGPKAMVSIGRSDGDVQFMRSLANEGMPVARTVRYRRIGGDTRCGVTAP